MSDNGVPSIMAPWPTKDVCIHRPRRRCMVLIPRQIVYVSIMGAVMLAAFLEWFLWLAAFLYCLIKVFQKAEHWSIRLLATIMMIGFTLLRYAWEGQDRKGRTDTAPLDASSFLLWSLLYLFHPGLRSTFPKEWLRFCNGLPSGHLLAFSLFHGYFVSISLSQTHWDGPKGFELHWMKIRHRRL